MKKYTLLVCNCMFYTIDSISISLSDELTQEELITILLRKASEVKFNYPIHNLIYEDSEDFTTLEDLLKEYKKITGSEWKSEFINLI